MFEHRTPRLFMTAHAAGSREGAWSSTLSCSVMDAESRGPKGGQPSCDSYSSSFGKSHFQIRPNRIAQMQPPTAQTSMTKKTLKNLPLPPPEDPAGESYGQPQ